MTTAQKKKAYAHAYYVANKKRLLDYSKAWRKNNPEKRKAAARRQSARSVAYRKRWRKANSERVKIYARKWQRAHPDSGRRAANAWAKRNPDKIKAKTKRDRKIHGDKLRQRYREWKRKNPEKARALLKRWKARNPDKVAASSKNTLAKRRAQQKNCAHSATATDIRRLLALAKFCYYCEKPFNKQRKPTIDHIIPLAKGGAHSRDNLCLACCSCNSTKQDKHPHEYAREIGRLLI